MKKIIILLFMLLLTGCYDYNELNDLNIVSSIIVDYKEDEYIVNLEILDTSEKAQSGSHFVNGKGKNLEEAINDIYFDSTAMPYYSHMNVFIVSDTVAERGLSDFYDYLLRDAYIRKDFYFFVAEDIDAVLAYEPAANESLGDKVQKIADANYKRSGKFKTCNFREIIYHYLRDNDYLIGSMNIEEEEVTLEKNYVFIDNKLGFEVEEEVALFDNILYEANSSFQIYDDSSYEIHEYGLERKTEKNKIVLTLKGSARLINVTNEKAFSKDEVDALEKQVNEKIEKLFTDVINFSKKKDEDIFNFNYFYYLHYPRLVKDDTWKNIEYEINSEIKISEKGLLIDSLGGSKDAR